MRAIDADDLKTAFPVCDNSKPVLIASVRATINHMPTIEPEPHWIPCEERMPELNVYVIATTQWYEITMACRIGDGEWFINEGDSNAYDDDVIAWMPLPDPYSERRTDEAD